MVGFCKIVCLLLTLQLVHCSRNTRKRNNISNRYGNGKRERQIIYFTDSSTVFGYRPKNQKPELQIDLSGQYKEAAVEAQHGDHPYQVQLRDGKTKVHFCGGSILSSNLVLTGAQCVYSWFETGSLDRIEVIAGEHDTKTEGGQEQVRHIFEAFIHEDYEYTKSASDNDIALLVIHPEFNLNDFVKRIPIPNNATIVTGVAVLSGWGKKHMNDRGAVHVLHSLNLTVYNDLDCKESWEDQLIHELGRDVDMTKILCARHNAKTKSTTKLISCQGDKGSPLTCADFKNRKSGRFLCGVASGTDRYCGQLGDKPGVFADVRKFFPWITDKSSQVQMTYNCPCGYFQCNNEHCVDPLTLNDGNDDCGDKTDETPGIRDLFNNAKPMRKYWDVEDTKYKCHYNKTHPDRFRLISSKYVCDGIVDCPGNTPDICESLKQNPSICPNSHKEATRAHSDISNCKHITDETNCHDRKDDSVKCPNEDKYTLRKNICDSFPNCQDGSDEKNCTSCSSKSFHCPISQTCIRSSYRCDGEPDCPNGEDEKNCHTCHSAELNYHCPSNMSCILSQSRCDGHRDCPNGEDEENCDDCKATGFLCKQERKCIPDNFRCDGQNNCNGGFDEKNCTKCLRGRFLCKVAQKCILNKQRCDGSVDCTETNEDEMNCNYCRKHLFHCASESKCILPRLRCNGKKDCRGGEDEKNCNSCSNTDSSYHCYRSRECIAAKLRCNNRSDCSYNEDEEQCRSLRALTLKQTS